MKKLIVFMGSVFLLIMAWRLPDVWHDDTIALAAGIILGMLAPLPMLLMFVFAEPRPQVPQITIIDNSQHIYIIPAAVQHKAAEVGGSIELRGGQWCIIHDDGRVLRARLIERKD